MLVVNDIKYPARLFTLASMDAIVEPARWLVMSPVTRLRYDDAINRPQ